jgi:hypothetical protein
VVHAFRRDRCATTEGAFSGIWISIVEREQRTADIDPKAVSLGKSRGARTEVDGDFDHFAGLERFGCEQ